MTSGASTSRAPGDDGAVAISATPRLFASPEHAQPIVFCSCGGQLFHRFGFAAPTCLSCGAVRNIVVLPTRNALTSLSATTPAGSNVSAVSSVSMQPKNSIGDFECPKIPLVETQK